MKIAYFLDFPGCIGGASKVLLTQAYIMSQKGHQVIVILPEDENGKHAYEFDEISKLYHLNVTTAAYPVATTLEAIDIIGSLECCDEMMHLLSKEGVDLIHSTQINVAVELASRELGIPHLMNIYPTEPEAFDIKWLDVYPHYHSADSDFFCKRWRDGLQIPSRCIRVAYKNNSKRLNKEIKEISFPIRVISIGVLAEHKNQLEIIKFVWECKKKGIEIALTILGKDDTLYGQKCKEFVKQNHLEREITFQGIVLNIEDYFEQSDLMILSSVVESYPGVIVESMANKVPVIATPVAGIPELLQDGYNSFLTKGCSCEDIYEAFERFWLSTKESRMQDIINHAYETYEQNHSYEVVGTQLEAYYDWILKKHKMQAPYCQIDNIKNIWKSFIKEKNLKQADIYTQKSTWFLYHLYERFSLEKPERIAIWGAGFWGETALKWIDILDCKDRFVGFIDTYKQGVYFGYPILENREETVSACDVIFVAVGDVDGCLKIVQHLEKYKKKKNRDYFTLKHDLIRM